MTIEFETTDVALYRILEELCEVDSADPREAERQIRELLCEVFPGCGLESVPLFAVTQQGETALESLLHTLAPTLTAGAEACIASLIQKEKL